MTRKTRELKESSRLMKPSTYPAINYLNPKMPTLNLAATTQNSDQSFDQAIRPLSQGFKEIGEIVNSFEHDPSRAEMLAKARKRFAQTCNDVGMPLTIASLRLRSGLSQTKVALLLGNSQSSYSLIEAGQREMLYKTFEKLVDIFQVSRDELAQAIKNTKSLAQDSSN